MLLSDEEKVQAQALGLTLEEMRIAKASHTSRPNATPTTRPRSRPGATPGRRTSRRWTTTCWKALVARYRDAVSRRPPRKTQKPDACTDPYTRRPR